MQLVILAAGRGTRLHGENSELPKSLVSVGGKPYLSYQWEAFSKYDFSRCFVVCGHGMGHLKNFFESQAHSGVKAELLFNAAYEKGNLHSLKTALPHLTEDFFIFNADHFYSPENYRKILTHGSDEISVFCDEDRPLGADDMKVKRHGTRGTPRYVEAISKTLLHYDCGYVGVTRVPRSQFENYKRALIQVQSDHGDQANVELVIGALAAQNFPVLVQDISGSWWTEIDTPEDLTLAQLKMASRCR